MDKRVTTAVLFEAARLSAELDAGATLKFYRPDAPRGIRYVLRNHTHEDRRRGQAARVLAHVASGLLCEVTSPAANWAPQGAAHGDDKPFDQAVTRLVLELRARGGVIEGTHPTLPPCAFGQAHSDLEGAVEEKLRAGYMLRVAVRHDAKPPAYLLDYAAVERSVLAFMRQAHFPVVRTSKERRNPLPITGLRALRRKTLIWPNGLAGYVGGAIYRQREGLHLLVYHTGRTSSQSPTVYSAQQLADQGVRCLVDGSESGESTPCWTEAHSEVLPPGVRPLSDARMNALVGHELRWPGGDVRVCVGLSQVHTALCAVVRPLRADGGVSLNKALDEYHTAQSLANDRVVCKKRTGVDVGATFRCWEEEEEIRVQPADKLIRTPLRVHTPLDDDAMRLLAGKLLVWPCGDTRQCVGVAQMYGGVCAQLAPADGMVTRRPINARELAEAGVQWVYEAGGPLHPCWGEK